ncbi:hypothetical protein F5Y03DRAFT_168255 [Xylaria venustula]|nr:hypothetical protein F5Y03DRAFT_168255 [Xylaria venustula]
MEQRGQRDQTSLASQHFHSLSLSLSLFLPSTYATVPRVLSRQCTRAIVRLLRADSQGCRALAECLRQVDSQGAAPPHIVSRAEECSGDHDGRDWCVRSANDCTECHGT